MMMRRMVAGLGRTFISMGVLLLLFVAYQLWGTGIAYSKAQNQGRKEFEQRVAASGQSTNQSVTDEFSPGNLGGFTPPLAVTQATGAPSTVVPTTIVVPETAVTADSTVPAVSVESTVPPVTVTTLPKVRAGRSKMKRVVAGKVLGRMVIPRIKKDLGFYEGAGVEDLKGGPGHYEKTPLPGSEGNVGIACHRTTYGAPCFNLNLLQVGDPIFFQTDYGKFRYEVVSHTIVGPKDRKVLAATPGESVLTVTTCHPQYSASSRYVVRARLVGTAVDTDLYFEPEPVITVPPTTIAPVTVAPTTVALPAGDNPVVVDTSLDGLGEPPETTVVAPAVVDSVPDTTPSLLVPESLRPGHGRVITVGWFSGRLSFWKSTVLWTCVCAAIWIGAWLLARRRRLLGQVVIYGLGFLLVFLPALYFCFENLAHLLPENV